MKPNPLPSLYLLLAFVLTLPACTPSSSPTPPAGPLPTATSPAAPAPHPTQTPTAAPTPQGVPPETLRGLEIELWHAWSGRTADALEDLLTEFNIENESGVRATTRGFESYSALSKSMSTAIQQGRLPNLAVAYASHYLAWQAAAQVVVDLTPYIADPATGLDAAAQADFYPAFWAQDLIASQRLGLPAQRSGLVVLYNLTWAKTLGFSAPPITPAEFMAQACAAAAANNADASPENDGTGGWLIDPGASSITGWIYAFGGTLENPAGGYTFATPETEAAFTFLHTLAEQGCAWKPAERFPNAEFAARQGLFYTSSVAGIPFQATAMEKAGSLDQWTAIPLPSVTGEPVIAVYGPSFVVLESTPELQLASWLLLEYLSEPASQAAWVRANSYFPLRKSALGYLEAATARSPQWGAALALLDFARFEPRFESWGSVRNVVEDAASELLRPGFPASQIPDLLRQLDATANELDVETK